MSPDLQEVFFLNSDLLSPFPPSSVSLSLFFSGGFCLSSAICQWLLNTFFWGGGVANYISFLVSLKMELVHFPSFFFFSCNFMEKMEIQSDTRSGLCSRSPLSNPNAVYLCPFLMWETEDLRLGESSEDSFPLNSEGNVRTETSTELYSTLAAQSLAMSCFGRLCIWPTLE